MIFVTEIDFLKMSFLAVMIPTENLKTKIVSETLFKLKLLINMLSASELFLKR